MDWHKVVSIAPTTIFLLNRLAILTNKTAPPRSCSPSAGVISALQCRCRPWVLSAMGASTVTSLGRSTISLLGFRGSCWRFGRWAQSYVILLGWWLIYPLQVIGMVLFSFLLFALWAYDDVAFSHPPVWSLPQNPDPPEQPQAKLSSTTPASLSPSTSPAVGDPQT